MCIIGIPYIDEGFHQAQLPFYCRNIRWNKFCQCGRGHHILYIIVNTGQKICVIKFSPMRAGGKICENFLNFCLYGSL